jgi:hypothetical protein
MNVYVYQLNSKQIVAKEQCFFYKNTNCMNNVLNLLTVQAVKIPFHRRKKSSFEF